MLRLWLVLFYVLWASTAEAALCTLTWNANSETDLAGYRAYHALSSNGYSMGHPNLVLGLETTTTCEALAVIADGLTHFFVVTATNTEGLESAPSNEVSILVPIPPPLDTDGDGIPDILDHCPTQPGPFTNNGCPVIPPPPIDTDGDGIPDSSDACPTQPGPSSNNGCPVITPPPPPIDTDGDGIPDNMDACPTQPAPGTIDGCPVIVPPPPPPPPPPDPHCVRYNPHGKCTKWSNEPGAP